MYHCSICVTGDVIESSSPRKKMIPDIYLEPHKSMKGATGETRRVRAVSPAL